MVVGFTGTRHGMSARQRAAVRQWLTDHEPGELHHGACHLGGADAHAHALAKELGWRVVVHPSNLGPLLDFYRDADEVREPLPPLVRNRNIVAAVEYLLATPRTREVEPRSGTDTTIRYAKQAGVPGLRIAP